MTIEAKVICDSIGDHSPRLLSQLWVAPKFIHQESLRHRAIYIMDFLRAEFDPDFSFSVSSSRAIPHTRMVAEARDPAKMAKPVEWGAEQRGMSPGEEVDNIEKVVDIHASLIVMGVPTELFPKERFMTKREAVEFLWELHGEISARITTAMVDMTGVHKSIPNRLIEAHVHVRCMATATEPGWMNFYGLRLDKTADPTLRALAEASWRDWNESQPRLLKPGHWHLPFVDNEYEAQIHEYNRFLGRDNSEELDEAGILLVSREVSVACSAHLSYESFETGARMTLGQCVKLHDRLVKSVPIHASPAEHQATPDKRKSREVVFTASNGDVINATFDNLEWQHPEKSGNLGPGWIQYRKLLIGEAIAPLPENYR